MTAQHTPGPLKRSMTQEDFNTRHYIYVPALFWDDHSERCPCDGDPDFAMASEVRRAGKRVLIEGNAAQIECLRSDAAFYADPSGPDECPRNIINSARATLAAIAKVTGQEGGAA
jgi:hypothetical protein